MEESELIPEDKNSIESSSDIEKQTKKEENVKAFTEFLETTIKEESNEAKKNSVLNGKKAKNENNSLFKKFLNDGFDLSLIHI